MGLRKIALPACLRCCRKKPREDKTIQDENNDTTAGQHNPERENWSNKSDYLLSLIGYAVGLGNVWRFPYLAYQNGGGAYIIPFVIMLVFAGMPLFFLECSLGQFSSSGPIAVWRVLPILQGVGVTMVLISALVAIYYNVIIAYSLYYLFAGFRKVLPWSECFEWADKHCSNFNADSCNASMGHNDTLTANLTGVGTNETCIGNSDPNGTMELPSQQYWSKVALRESGSLDETGQVVWHLALCLLLSWILVAASLCKGIKSSGKVVYFTAIFPYVVLIILLVRGATLEGAVDGINFFIGTNSDISKLSNAEGWKDAATQIFYSLSTAQGGLVALSSYNKFRYNCYLDSLVVCFINLLTSILAGLVIFSILGHMAHVSGKSVDSVAKGGFDLAFVAYPFALTKLPVSPLWSFLFFFMLLLLGLDSQFALIETVTTSVEDAYPHLMKRLRIPITAGCCIVLFLLGLSCVTQAGIYWVNLIDYFTGGWALLIAAVLELVGICWIYGTNRLIEDIEMMIGKKSWLFWLWWRACWFFISPVLLVVIFVWSLVTFTAPTYNGVPYPAWGTALGWLMIIFCVIWIPIVAIAKVYKAEGTLWQRIVKCCRPAANWGPALPQNRGERYKHMEDTRAPDAKDLELPTVIGSDNPSFQTE
ncbi:sodium- and chloride-dependent neutral and basic amino acid transporter B(0+)-like [Ambystoma mexicanum]|uniref:sodium- and chloride-dependent neutral and basic amino acid transporter B(0+)-like n=1 Tax=Ambystoma mexicanum TaxID=8296 RepID=UPI0037E8200C